MKIDLEFHSTKKGIELMKENYRDTQFVFRGAVVKGIGERFPISCIDFYYKLLKRICAIFKMHSIYRGWKDEDFTAFLSYTSSVINELDNEIWEELEDKANELKAEKITMILKSIYWISRNLIEDKALWKNQ